MDFLDFGDWLSDAVDYVGDAFSSAADTVSGLFEGDSPAKSSITEEVIAQKVSELGDENKLAEWVKSLSSTDKKAVEDLVTQKMLMSGLATGAGEWLKSNAQDKMLEAQDRRSQADRDWQTAERQRRGGGVPQMSAAPRPVHGGLVASRMGGGG